ncbi:hypothetical protein [Actinoplanes sp. URMC 104]
MRATEDVEVEPVASALVSTAFSSQDGPEPVPARSHAEPVASEAVVAAED